MALPFSRESDETDRLLALSDGVIAIAITLLVLEITVPEIPVGAPISVLPSLMLEQWHEFFGFALSFLVIGSYWVNHRRIFTHIERHDKGILWLNLLFLLMVAFIPFASSVFATYPNRFGIMFLSGTLALTGVTLALLWSYATRRELLEEGITSRLVEIQTARFLASPFVFVLSIILTAFNPVFGIVAWLLLIPVNAVFQSRLAETLGEGASDSESRTSR